MDENLAISEQNTRINAASLHAEYLGEEVYIWKEGRQGILGVLESFRIRRTDAPSEEEPFNRRKPESYSVKVVVSGTKLELKGDSKLILTDGAPVPRSIEK